MILFVFDLGFSQRSSVKDTPMDRTETFINRALFDELAQNAHDHRLIVRRHRLVRIGKIAEYAQPLEIISLALYITVGMLARSRANFYRGQGAWIDAFVSKLFVDLNFNRESVAIQARN